MLTSPTYSAPLDQVTTAMLALWRSTGRTVYDAAYAGDPLKPAYPYAIAYRIAGGSSDQTPDLGMSMRDVTVVYQLTVVSSLRNQAEATARLMRDRFLARDETGWVYGIPLPTGWIDSGRRPDEAMPGIDRAGDPPNAIYQIPARYYLTISPDR